MTSENSRLASESGFEPRGSYLFGLLCFKHGQSLHLPLYVIIIVVVMEYLLSTCYVALFLLSALELFFLFDPLSSPLRKYHHFILKALKYFLRSYEKLKF